MEPVGIFFYILGSIIVITVIFALLIAITARKIDFGEKIFNLKDRETLFKRPLREKALAALDPPEEIESRKSKSKQKFRKSKSSKPSPRPVDTKKIRDEPAKDEMHYERVTDAFAAGSEHAPKYEEEAKIVDEEAELVPEAKEWEEEVEMAAPPGIEDGEMSKETLGETAEITPFEGFSRDLSIMIPKNMCLDEVFRLKITLIRDKKFDEKLTFKELTMDKESAEYFSMNVTKLGEKVIEATTRIHGLEQGTLIVRPIAIGHVAALAPQQRVVYFHPELDEIVVEFFITPSKWSKDLDSNLRLEFEQNYRILLTLDIPIKIYKRKLEAVFGINISKWQTIVLFVYSAFGTISGLLSFLWDQVVPFFQNLFGIGG
jgi:hypothetical protein